MNCTYEKSRVGSQFAKTTEIYTKNAKGPKVKHRYNGDTPPIATIRKSCKSGKMVDNEKNVAKLSRSSILTANS